MAGILLGIFTGVWPVSGVCAALAGLAMMFSGIFLGRQGKLDIACDRLKIVGIATLFLGAGIWDGALSRPPELTPDHGRIPAFAHARILEVGQRTDGQNLLVNVDGFSDTPGGERAEVRAFKAVVFVRDAVEYAVDDYVVFLHDFKEVAENPNVQDKYAAHRMRGKGVVYSSFMGDTEIVKAGRYNDVRAFFNRLHNSFVGVINGLAFSERSKRLLGALLAGDSAELSDDVRERFSSLGLAHILSISGLHIGIIFFMLQAIFLPFRGVLGFKGTAFLSLAIVWAYIILTGMPVSAVRAGIMFSCLVGALALERPTASLNALFAAAVIILAFKPYDILNAGFQFSFVCVGMLLMFAQRVNPLTPKHNPVLVKTFGLIITTLMATLATWPLVLFYFNSLPLLSLVSNFVVLPLLPPFIGLSLLVVTMGSVGLEWTWLTATVDKSLTFLLDEALPLFPVATVEGWPHWLTPLLWLAALAGFAMYVNKKHAAKLAASLSLALLACVSVFALPSAKPADGLIVKQSTRQLVVAQYKDGHESLHRVPIGRTFDFTLSGYRIISAGANTRAVWKEAEGAPVECDILILTRGFNVKIDEMLQRVRPKLVLLHPSLFDQKTDYYSTELKKLNLPTYSLADEGPLWLRPYRVIAQ